MKYFNLRSLIPAVLASLLTLVVISQAQVPGVNNNLNAMFNLVYDNSTMKPTYSASGVNTVQQVSATDFCSITGSATKTVKIRRVIISGFSGTAVTEPVSIIRRSTANTGAGTTMIQAVYDTSNSLASGTNAGTVALAEMWTAPPTAGTFVSQLADVYISFALSTGSNSNYEFTFGTLGSPVVLRGVAQTAAANLNGNTFVGNLACTWEWTEE